MYKVQQGGFGGSSGGKSLLMSFPLQLLRNDVGATRSQQRSTLDAALGY